jgi:beta-xylosidase
MENHQERARKLHEQMTIKEKIAQLYAVWLKIEPSGGFTLRDLSGFSVGDLAADAKSILEHGIGQITRPLGTHAIPARDGVRGLNEIQKFLKDHTRLGIPALPHEECLAGVMADGATLFPAGINYGSMWDDDLMERVARAIGNELVAVGSKQGLAPVMDVERDARWGRTEETFGEDPYLAGCLGAAYVRGIQGTSAGSGERRALATVKHFVGHSFSEGGRNHAPVRVGERELNDIFLLPFEMAVKLANVGSVMPAYHDIDGEPSSASRRYVTDVLRGQWGFDGLVVSDYEAISLLFEHHHVAKDKAEASALAVKAGMDQELPGFTCYREGLEEALRRKLLGMEEIDEAVMRVLVMKSRLGLFENPYVKEDAIVLNGPEHRAVAAEAAEKSIVLLKNDGALPFPETGTTAVIGPLADDHNAMFCGYSFPVHVANGVRAPESATRYGKTLREAFAARIGEKNLIYARGCDLLSGRPTERPVFPGDADASHGQRHDIVALDTGKIAEAVAAARRADRVVLAVGDLAGLFLTGTVGEGSDASSLELPGVQQQLLEALLETGKPVVVVLVNGRPYNLHGGYERANAVLEAWLPGQEGADVVVDILHGRRSPGGRLPVSIPKSAGAMPYFYNHKLKAAGTPVQRDYGALYPFGFGMSYTSFAYRDCALSQKQIPADGTIVVTGRVRNTGKRDGDEVIQLYVRDVLAALVRPIIELKGFKRVPLAAGQEMGFRASLPADMLSYTMRGTERVVEPGEFEVMIGRSSEDIVFRDTVTVTGAPRVVPNAWRMQSSIELS